MIKRVLKRKRVRKSYNSRITVGPLSHLPVINYSQNFEVGSSNVIKSAACNALDVIHNGLLTTLTSSPATITTGGFLQIHRCHSSIQIVNASNVGCEMQLMAVKYRKLFPNTQTPYNILTAGLNSQTGAGYTANTLPPAVDPFEVRYFTQSLKVMKRWSKQLLPGQLFDAEYEHGRCIINAYDNPSFTFGNNNFYYHPKCSWSWFWIFVPQTVVSGDDHSQEMTGVCKLNAKVRNRFDYSQIQGTATSQYFSDFQGTIGASSVLFDLNNPLTIATQNNA